MEKSIFARSQTNKRTKIFDAHYFAFINFSYFWNFHNTKNCIFGSFTRSGLNRSNANRTIFFDFYGCSRFILKTTNDFTTRTYNITNFVNRNMNSLDMWCIGADFFTRRCNSFKHVLHDECATLFSLRERTS